MGRQTPVINFLFNVHGYKPAFDVGGPIQSVAALAEGLVSRGHHVSVATSNRDLNGPLDVDPTRFYNRDGVQVRYFASGPTLMHRTRIPYFAQSKAFNFHPDLMRWINANGPTFDVFHTQMTYLQSNPFFSSAARRFGKCYLYHQRGNLDPVRLRYRAWKKRLYIALVEKKVMRRADALIALTSYEKGSYRELGLRNRVEIIPNGVRIPPPPPSPGEAGPEAEKILDWAGDRPMFLFLSRMHPLKGPEVLVEALIQTAPHQKDFVAVVAGPDEMGMSGKLARKIAEAGLGGRIKVVGSFHGGAKAALLHRADCFLLPTASEGFSMALLEALASGCAVITTPGAHFEEIGESGAGFIIEPNAEKLGDAIGRLAAQGRGAMREMGRRGLALVEAKYTWPVIVGQYEALCLELMSRPRR